jgi:hypothetical protein
MRRLIQIFTLFCVLTSQGQSLLSFAGAQHQGAPTAYIADTSTWAMMLNPAGLAMTGKSMATGAEQRFGLSELQIKGLSGRYQNWGISMLQGGPDEFQSWAWGIGYGRQFGSIAAGMRFHHTTIRQGIWGKTHYQTGLDAGIIYQLEQMEIGYLIRNVGAQIDRQPFIPAPHQHQLALKWHTDPLIIRAGLHMEGARAPGTAVVLEYAIGKSLAIRGGWSHQPGTWSLATLVSHRDFVFCLGSWWHERLGHSPSFSIEYVW